MPEKPWSIIEKYQLRLRDQRQYDKKPLAFATRKTLYRCICLIPDAELLTELAPIGRAAVKACGFLTKLGNPDLLLIVTLLKLHTDTLEQSTALFLWVLSQQANCSRIRLLCAEHTLDCSAFSGTVGTERPEYRTAFHGQVQMIDHGFSGIGFRQPFNKNRLAHF